MYSMLDYFPKYYVNRAIATYFLSLAVVSILFFNNIMDFTWMLFGSVEVIGFFYFSNVWTKQWRYVSEKRFVRNIFWAAFLIRLIYVTFSYFFYIYLNGNPFEFTPGDSLFYEEMGHYGASLIREGHLHIYPYLQKYANMALSDSGEPILLSYIYFFVGDSIYLSRVVKALLSSFTVVFIYRLAQRNFGEQIGRIAAVFAVLLPHFIYYCGVQLKECEMVFLTAWCIERVDALTRLPKIKMSNIVLPLLLGLSLFFFRTVLGISVLFATGVTFVLSDNTVLSKSRRWQVIAIGVLAAGFLASSIFAQEIEELYEARKLGQNQQSVNMQWRSTRKSGNIFAKYGSAVVFAPMIFSLPFPTMVQIDTQLNQMQVNGNNYIKNIMSVFVVMSILLVVKSKSWRSNLLLEAYYLSYLAILALSNFAQSERFHFPSLPIAVIYFAYGLTHIPQSWKKYFNYWCMLEFVIIIGWSWFKLRGRGLI